MALKPPQVHNLGYADNRQDQGRDNRPKTGIDRHWKQAGKSLKTNQDQSCPLDSPEARKAGIPAGAHRAATSGCHMVSLAGGHYLGPPCALVALQGENVDRRWTTTDERVVRVLGRQAAMAASRMEAGANWPKEGLATLPALPFLGRGGEDHSGASPKHPGAFPGLTLPVVTTVQPAVAERYGLAKVAGRKLLRGRLKASQVAANHVVHLGGPSVSCGRRSCLSPCQDNQSVSKPPKWIPATLNAVNRGLADTGKVTDLFLRKAHISQGLDGFRRRHAFSMPIGIYLSMPIGIRPDKR